MDFKSLYLFMYGNFAREYKPFRLLYISCKCDLLYIHWRFATCDYMENIFLVPSIKFLFHFLFRGFYVTPVSSLYESIRFKNCVLCS